MIKRYTVVHGKFQKKKYRRNMNETKLQKNVRARIQISWQKVPLSVSGVMTRDWEWI